MSTYYFLPTRNVFGAGCVNETGELAKSLKMKKPLIVTDKYLNECGLAGRVVEILRQSGLETSVFAGAEPNPKDYNVVDGFEQYKKDGCDSIISIGGGSPHDCAKGIGLLASNGGEIKDYEGVDKSTNPLVPLMAINTTAGTASEITRFTIITDTKRHIKMAIIDWRITPLIAINDPELMVGMPKSLTAATGMDALTHAIEAYVSTAATPLTDSTAIYAIKLISKYLPKAVANGHDMVARDKMAYAQYLAGAAFNNASLGYVHAMAHQLGGMYDLPHGVCNAILLPYVCDFNLIACKERFKDIAEAMGVITEGLTVDEAAALAIEQIRLLSKQVGIPASLKELGVQEKDFEEMAKNAKNDACQLTNPRTASLEEVIEIYKKAY